MGVDCSLRSPSSSAVLGEGQRPRAVVVIEPAAAIKAAIHPDDVEPPLDEPRPENGTDIAVGAGNQYSHSSSHASKKNQNCKDRKELCCEQALFICGNLVEMIGDCQFFRYVSSGIVLGVIWALTGEPSSPGDNSVAEASTPSYPVRASSTNRYLVDQNDQPFMIVGDSPHSLIGRMSKSDVGFYMANRRRYGVNTLWVELLCNNKTGCNEDGTTFDGIAPFTTPGDLSTPNPEYFQRVDDMLKIAATHGITLLLDAVETDGWLATFKANGPEKAEAFGRYLGDRYRDVPNIIWMYGNDFQTWGDPVDDAVVLAVAKGIKSNDPNHIHTTELNYPTSGSLDDARWEPVVELDGAYTYYPTYAQVLKEYNRDNFKPIFMEEANYEFEHNSNTDGGSSANLRHQEYWTMLSGATGQLYGSAYTWRLPVGWFSDWRLRLSAGRLLGWHSNLDTPGVMQLRHMKNLFAPRKWYELVPDQTHTAVTGGYGTPAPFGTGSVTTDTYATAARTPDGTLMIAYMPSIRTISVDMSKLAGPTAAHWYDPTNAEYISVSGSPFPNEGTRQFTPPGNNHDGDGDWLLLLESK